MVIYNASDAVNSTPPLGGSPTTLIPVSDFGRFFTCAWSPAADRIACANLKDGAIYIGDGDGRNLKRLTPASRDAAHSPAWSPDGNRIAYVTGNAEFLVWGPTLGNLAASSIWVIPSSGGDPVRVTDDNHLNTSPVWAADGGHLLFVSSAGGARDIYSQRVSSSGHADGAPARVTTGLNPHSISLSSDGRSLAYSVFNTTGNVWKASINGMQPIQSASMTQLTFGNQTIESMSVSRDERWLAYDSNVNGNADIYRLSLAGGEPQQLTHDPADDFSPVWSPDGSQIAFHSFRNGTRDVFVMSADGSRVEPVIATPAQERLATWSADGQSVAFVVMPDSVFISTRKNGHWGPPRFLVNGSGALWSPDGKNISIGAASGILLVTPDGTRGKTIDVEGQEQLGIYGGTWSADSHLQYYNGIGKDGTSIIGAVDVATLESKILYHFSDPLRQIYRFNLWADSKNIFFTLGTRESDVWVMELKNK